MYLIIISLIHILNNKESIGNKLINYIIKLTSKSDMLLNYAIKLKSILLYN